MLYDQSMIRTVKSRCNQDEKTTRHTGGLVQMPPESKTSQKAAQQVSVFVRPAEAADISLNKNTTVCAIKSRRRNRTDTVGPAIDGWAAFREAAVAQLVDNERRDTGLVSYEPHFGFDYKYVTRWLDIDE
jgi:hypothetical protein